MKDELTEEQVKAILDALDETIASGPWEESVFLRVIGKNLREIRNNFAKELDMKAEVKNQLEQSLSGRFIKSTLSADQREVFISLYSSEGSNIQAWERILGNLPKQVTSRPIYSNEFDIQDVIKSKENKVNEAYVVFYVNKNDILTLQPDKISMDKRGKQLMSLKDRALKIENIIRFVHMSIEYNYHKGRLVKQDT